MLEDCTASLLLRRTNSGPGVRLRASAGTIAEAVATKDIEAFILRFFREKFLVDIQLTA